MKLHLSIWSIENSTDHAEHLNIYHKRLRLIKYVRHFLGIHCNLNYFNSKKATIGGQISFGNHSINIFVHCLQWQAKILFNHLSSYIYAWGLSFLCKELKLLRSGSFTWIRNYKSESSESCDKQVFAAINEFPINKTLIHLWCIY